MNNGRCLLYSGTVSHTRLAPVVHGFAYDVAMLLIDIDRTDDAFRGCWPLGGRSWAAATFRETDHMKARRRGASLGEAVRELIAAKTGRPPPRGRILLLTNPAYFGYFFAPVSFYYVFEEAAHDSSTAAAEGEPPLYCIVAEVNNTPWNEQHCYVLHPDCPDVRAFVAAAASAAASSTASDAQADADSQRLDGRKEAASVGAGTGAGLAALGAFPSWDESAWVTCPAGSPTATAKGARASSGSSNSAAPSPSGHCDGLRHRPGAAAAAAILADAVVAGSPVAAGPSAGASAAAPPPAASTSTLASAWACPSHGRQWRRFLWGKAFHVSPFMPMGQAYDWVFNAPALPSLPSSSGGSRSGGCAMTAEQKSAAAILIRSRNLQLADGGKPAASMCPAAASASVVPPGTSAASAAASSLVGARHPIAPAVLAAGAPTATAGPCVFTTQTRLRCEGAVSLWQLAWLMLYAFPLLTHRLQWWIHAEAVRLYRKGVPLFAHPSPDGGPQTLMMRAVSALAALLLPLITLVRRLFALK